MEVNLHGPNFDASRWGPGGSNETSNQTDVQAQPTLSPSTNRVSAGTLDPRHRKHGQTSGYSGAMTKTSSNMPQAPFGWSNPVPARQPNDPCSVDVIQGIGDIPCHNGPTPVTWRNPWPQSTGFPPKSTVRIPTSTARPTGYSRVNLIGGLGFIARPGPAGFDPATGWLAGSGPRQLLNYLKQFHSAAAQARNTPRMNLGM